MDRMPNRLAWFVTPHGLGHAARAAAIMRAINQPEPTFRHEIFTTVPAEFFADSDVGDFGLHTVATDIGLVQHDAMTEDLAATVDALDRRLPFAASEVEELARHVRTLDCAAVVCDIAPLGLLVARAAAVPSVLVENFTWDWIYESYLEREPRLRRHAEYLARLFSLATHRIQTEPVCRRVPGALAVPPVSRAEFCAREETRRRLRIESDTPAVLITTGGIPERHGFLERLAAVPGMAFVLPGMADEAAGVRERGNLRLLSRRSGFHHPDLVRAADAVVGKLGYSTVAEVYAAGTPFAYVRRVGFRESEALARFAAAEMDAEEVALADFREGLWVVRAKAWASRPRLARADAARGAERAASLVRSRVTWAGRIGPMGLAWRGPGA